jgi:hypothetical protein
MKLEILDLFEPGEWDWLKQDMLDRIDAEGVDRLFDESFADSVWGIKGLCRVDRRVVLAYNDPAFMMIKQILDRHFHGSQWFYIAYQRQYIPHGLHVDIGDRHYASSEGYSLVIPMQQSPEFKLFLWDKKFDSMDQLQEFRNEIKTHPEKYIPVNNLSQDHQLAHCNLDLPITDYMELAGIYEYKIGTIAKFPKNHVHASHDWLASKNHTHKDLIIIHSMPPSHD